MKFYTLPLLFGSLLLPACQGCESTECEGLFDCDIGEICSEDNICIVPDDPGPTIRSFTAAPTSIFSGEEATLSWETANASDCSILGIGSVACSGVMPVSPELTTSYQLTAEGEDATVSASTIITVNDVIDAGFDAGPTDAGIEDAGFDAGPTDAGFDAGIEDAGFDAGPTDAGFDAGIEDAGFDAGPIDAGFDAGIEDAGFDAGPPPTVQLSAGDDATCATREGDVWCWGGNDFGQLGLGHTNTPLLPEIVDIGFVTSQVHTGYQTSCAVSDDGSVKCWGSNSIGQLGLGDTDNRGDSLNEMGDALPLVSLGFPSGDVEEVVLGATHACARTASGLVKCWGGNDFGELGLGDTVPRGDDPGEMGAALSTVSLPGSVKDISAGIEHTCALLDNGTIGCWGSATGQFSGTSGHLGNGSNANVGDGPGEMGGNLVLVDLRANAVSIATGYYHTCALLVGGLVQCWGGNTAGQLGLGDTVDRGSSPDQMGAALPFVDIGGEAIAIAASTNISCALLTGGAVKCWGAGAASSRPGTSTGDQSGEMGVNLPSIDLGGPAVSITAGNGHACAMLADGDVKCWGRNDDNQLGLGDFNTRGDEINEMGDNLPAVVLE